MYLSRVKLDLYKKNTQYALVTPSKLHGAVENCFPKKENRNDCLRKLWRIDKLYGDIYLLILSSEKPDLNEIVNEFGNINTGYEIKEYDKLLDRIENDSEWHFRLVANPTRSIKKENGRGKIVAHNTPEVQIKWLINQSIKSGFKINENTVGIISSKWLIFKKKDDKKVRILAVTYEGTLKITDNVLFKNILVNGIGREKAYGMGMLTIMKI